MVLFPILGPVIHLTHTTPGRLLSHLRKLTSAGESLLARPPIGSTEKRRKAAALQDAMRNTMIPEIREASWTAPALWRFA